jgi:hypothetical protein
MNGKQYPQLSLPNMPIDLPVARQLPRGLADYYAALPIGEDRGRLTVAMAQPGDPKSNGVLRNLLGSGIVPVQAGAPDIRAAICRVWQNESAAGAQVLCCGAIPPLAQLFAESLSADLVTLEASVDALAVAGRGNYRLTVTAPGSPAHMARWVLAVPGALLFAADEPHEVRRILVVLRGHAPDQQALEVVLPLARHCRASITLLAIDECGSGGLTRWLAPHGATRSHLHACAQRLCQVGISGSLRLREGDPAAQVAAEVAGGDYDLLAVAAEAHGVAINHILAATLPNHQVPVLVLKPALNGGKGVSDGA